jgi:hypothetical protein
MRAMRKLSVPMISIAVLTLAACGGGGTAAASSTTTTTPGGRGFRNAAFTTCLKQHGVTLPSGGFGGGGRRGASGASGATGPVGRRPGGFFGGGGAGLSQKEQAAFSACRSKLPNGGQFGGGLRGGANATALKAYLSCLSDHGVTVPKTPVAGASGPAGPGGFRSPLASLRNDPKFAAARQACRVLLPARDGASPTATPAG